MKKTVTIEELFDILEDAVKDFPETLAEHTFHTYKSPFFTLVSTILSARTKDSLTIKRLPALWERAKTPQDYTEISQSELECYCIYQFFHHESQIDELGQILHTEKQPTRHVRLIKLPGAGRKPRTWRSLSF
jgi:endonuclease III